MFFIPYRIDHRLQRVPYATLTLMILCTLAYVASLADHTAIVNALGFRMDASGLYTWFTAMFIHADPIHLLGNMYFLWLIGSVVEDAIGPWRYLGIYAVGGLASAVLHGAVIATYAPTFLHIPMVGASGALAAIMGVFAVRFYRTKVKFAYFFMIFLRPFYGTVSLTSIFAIALWLANEVLVGMSTIGGAQSGVASWAHVGGLLCGAVVALMRGGASRATLEYLADEARQWDPRTVGSIAADKYADLAQKDPDNPEWHLQWARSAMAGGPQTQAIVARELRKGVGLLLARGEVELALDAYDEMGVMLPRDTFDAASLLSLGSRAEGALRWDLAAELYRTLVEQYPDSPQVAKAVFRLAHVYLRLGSEAQAHQTWDRFLAQNPNSEWIPFADQALVAPST